MESTNRIWETARRHPSNLRAQALNYDPQHFTCRTSIGQMDIVCLCGALKFNGETPSMCCSNQQVLLDSFHLPPSYLAQLYDSDTPDSRHFLANIRKYNCVFQTTSFGWSEVHLPGWNPSFRVQGQVFHRIGSLMPPPNHPIYFLDSRCEETRARMSITFGLKHIVDNLCTMLHQCNHSVQLLKTARELLERNDMQEYRVVVKVPLTCKILILLNEPVPRVKTDGDTKSCDTYVQIGKNLQLQVTVPLKVSHFCDDITRETVCQV